MTVSYTAEVATSSFSCFLKLLARWKGSIYKLLWRDFALFATIYFLLQFLYRFILNSTQRKTFELISHYCESNNALIPVAFVLGFYVSIIMSRWWAALNMIPWPDHMAMYVTANVRDLGRSDEDGRLLRRTMLRYFNLAYVLTMTCVSTQVKKRFPTYQHMIKAGLMTAEENKILEKLSKKNQQYFIPLAWTTNLVAQARSQNRIKDDYAQKTLIDEINEFRRCLATLCVYDLVTVPLVYTQVVTIAVYMFFLSCLMGRQFLMDDSSSPDLFFPLFTFLEYFFYMGWLKVAECLVNPFGDDEDDFPMNDLIDRNLQVAYLLVDEVRTEFPQLQRDQFWDEADCQMPYTSAAAQFMSTQQLFKGSTMDVRIPQEDKEFRAASPTMGAIDEGEDEEDNYDEEDECIPQGGTSFFEPTAKVGSMNRQSSIESFMSRVGLPFLNRNSVRRSSINSVRRSSINKPRVHRTSETESIVASSVGTKGNATPSSSPPNMQHNYQEIFELELGVAGDPEHDHHARQSNAESIELKHMALHHPEARKTPSTAGKDTLLPHSHVGSGSSTAINLTNLYTVPEVTAGEEKSESIPSLVDRRATSKESIGAAAIPSEDVPPQAAALDIPSIGAIALPAVLKPAASDELRFRWSANITSGGGDPTTITPRNSASMNSPSSPSFLSPEPCSPIWIAQSSSDLYGGIELATTTTDSQV